MMHLGTMTKEGLDGVFRVVTLVAAIVVGMWALDQHWVPRAELDLLNKDQRRALENIENLLQKNFDEARCITLRIQRRNIKQDILILQLTMKGTTTDTFAMTALNDELAAVDRAINARCVR